MYTSNVCDLFLTAAHMCEYESSIFFLTVYDTVAESVNSAIVKVSNFSFGLCVCVRAIKSIQPLNKPSELPTEHTSTVHHYYLNIWVYKLNTNRCFFIFKIYFHLFGYELIPWKLSNQWNGTTFNSVRHFIHYFRLR